MSLIEPTCDIIDIVKPVLNIKDGGVKVTWADKKKAKRGETPTTTNEAKLARKEADKERTIARKNARKLRPKPR